MKITDQVWQVGGDGLSAPGDAAVYQIAFGDRAALIDAGHGHDRIIQNISRCLQTETVIEYLFLTHCHYDHIEGVQTH